MSGGAPSPASGLAACLTDDGECVEEAGEIPVRLDWESPSFGRAVRYFIYRFDVNPDAPFPPADLPTEAIATVEPPVEGSIATTFVDESAEGASNYAYFVITEFPDDDDADELPEFSGISNFARISTPGEQLPLPSPPEPLSPTDNAAILQNDPATGCSLLPGPNASRGRGFQILFDWTDAESPLEIAGYRISATKQGAAQPILDDVFVEGSAYTLRSCNAFVEDGNLAGWQWTVRTVDVEGQMSEPSAPGTFQFAQCRLDTGAPCSAPPGTGAGSSQDPLGDSVQSGSTPDRPDFTTGTVSVADGNITFSATFGAESFTTETLVQFVLDTDENPATGSPGVDSGCTNDATTMGTDFFVEVRGRSFDQPGIRVGRALGGCNSYSVSVAEGSVSFRPNGVDITISLGSIGSDDGRLRFKVLAATQLSAGSFTGVQDYGTDVGLAPGVVRP
jgi:hypothetical protein